MVFTWRAYHIQSHGGLRFFLLGEIGCQPVKAPLAAAISPYRYLISLTYSPTPPRNKCKIQPRSQGLFVDTMETLETRLGEIDHIEVSPNSTRTVCGLFLLNIFTFDKVNLTGVYTRLKNTKLRSKPEFVIIMRVQLAITDHCLYSFPHNSQLKE